MLIKSIWSGPAVRILYPQSDPVRLVRSEKYTQPNRAALTQTSPQRLVKFVYLPSY